MACKSNFEEYTINGVKVKFPYKPYPSQFTMMAKIIKCIERRQNSLLESPTGSGKSLALLCSSIAWLMVEKERILKQKQELERSRHRQMTDDIKPSCCNDNSIKEEQKPDIKVKIEQLNESNDVKPNIKTELNPEIKVKIEKTDPEEATDQKHITSGLNAEVNIKVEKTDESYDEKSNIKTELNMGEVSGENQMQAIDCVIEQTGDPKDDVCMEDDDFSDEDADFQAPKKRFRTPGGQMPRAKKRRQSGGELDDLVDQAGTSSEHLEWSMELNRPGEMSTDNAHSNGPSRDSHREDDDHRLEEELMLKEELQRLRSPKIYFGTRTHKQITQIVRELNKTEYRKTKMCILASRDHTCIHPYVSKAKNKTEECRKSVENKEGKSCSFFARARYVRNHEDLENYGFTKAWDIAELVQLGEKLQGCPYYMTRDIMKDSDIIFCPYNYLIDPIIRHQMDIQLLDQIVILDEAHNIEDSSRGAASWSVTTQSLDEAMIDLDLLVSKNIHREQHQVFHQVCATMRRWIIAKVDYQTGCHDSSKSSKIWEGQELKQALNSLGFVPAAVCQLVKHFKKVTKPPEPSKIKDKRERTNMHAPTATLFEKLLMVLSFIMNDDYKYLCDYRMAITKDYTQVPKIMPNGFRRTGDFEKKLICTLNFWCLSPAVAFSEISRYSRSVILTSGTLSPMSTFSSELGCKFPIQLEANHVVGSSQVWVSSLSVGPSGSTLNATYRYAETFDFQDEVGEAIYRVCEAVPHGVLCFLPSYGMLDKLMRRWKMTGLWGRLCRLKNTFSEPRGGDKADFNDLMSDFYDCIKMSEDSDGKYGPSGALFLAVCRGKVSEGLDFADNNARAVITVGIPFPNVKDIQVELKRKYNNQYCSLKGLLCGSEWYEIQAYRALNQALGRCIRHRNDWGAILLIDERFGKSPKYRNGLSKWIRGKVVHHNNFANLLSSLKKFAKDRLDNPCPNNSMLQTPSGTPKRDSNETKCSQESPISVNSSSQSSQTTSDNSKMDVSCINAEPASAKPIPTCPQPTPQLLSNHVPGSNVSSLQQCQYTPQKPTNQNSANTHMVSGQKHPQVPETLVNLQLINNPQQMGNLHPQQINNPQNVNNLQQLPHTGLNGPVLLRFVSPSGQPVRHALVTGQRLQFLTPQTAIGSHGNNGGLLSVLGGGQQATTRARLVQLGVNQGIRFNTTGQPGLNMTGEPRSGGTSGPNGVPQGDPSGLMSTPSVVRVKEEPKSPSDEVQARSESGGLTSTPGVKQGSHMIQGGLHGQLSRMQRRPLFLSHNSESNQPLGEMNLFETNKNTNAGLNESANAGHNDGSSLLKSRNNVPKPFDISKCVVTEPKDGVLPKCGSPESPLLFCTPPTSFECSDDESREGVDRVKMGHKGTIGDRKVLEKEGHEGTHRVKLGHKDATGDGNNLQEEGGEGIVRVKCEPMDTTESNKTLKMVGVTKNNGGSERIDGGGGKMDILDMLDDAVETNISNNVTWNVKCKACNSTFYSNVNGNSDDSIPKEKNISAKTFLGNILNSSFSLNTDRRKKKSSTLKTVHVADVNVLQECCPAFAYQEGKQNKQDAKLNSIYCEEESQCYVSLICKQCKESRTTRGRASIVAVRAMPCGTGNHNKSMVWFTHDKVKLISPV